MARPRGERGAATPLVLVLVVVAIVGAAGVARISDAAVRRARADAVADLTALAAVDGDVARADRVASESGARLVEVVRREGGGTVVRVDLGGAVAAAAAVRVG